MAWVDSAATYYWAGTDAEGYYKNATGNNWVNAAGTVAGAGKYPGLANADSIVFPSWAVHALSANAVDDADLNNAALTGSIVDITVDDGFAHAIGSRQYPLYLKMSGSPALKFDSDDHGDIYLLTGTTAVASCNVLKTADSEDALHLGFGSTICTLLNVLGGTVVLDATLFGVTNLGATTLTVAKQEALAAPNLMLAAPVATMLTNRGGVIDWIAGTVDELKNHDGTFRCEKSTTARTLTASTCYGGVVDFRTGVPGTITLTADIAYLGGEVYWDFGENLGRS